MLSGIRDKIKPVVEKVAKPFVKIGLKPGHITVIALLVGIFAGLLLAWNRPIIAGFVVLIGGFFDMIDGTVARLTESVTDFGGVMDSVFDRITDSALYIGVLAGGFGSFYSFPDWMLPVLALVGSYMVSYVRARAEAAGTGELDVGIAERAERLIILAVGSFFGLINYALLLIVVLTFVTVAQRVWASYKNLSSSR